MLPREIRTEHGPEMSRFDLPRRPIGALRFIGLVPMLFAVGFAWMPGGQMLRSLRQIISGSGAGFEWFMMVFLSVFVIAAMLPFGLGLFMLAGRTRVTVGKNRIIVTDIAGPVRWSRRWKFERIERLEIGGAKSSDGYGTSPLGSMCGIVAVFKDGKKTPLAVGYPRAWLQPLVEEISGLMQRRGAKVTVQEAAPMQADDSVSIETAPRLEKPTGSLIELSTSNWGAEFKVPSRGLWKESYGLVGFGAVWCVMVGVIGSFVFGKQGLGEGLIILPLFFAIGIGMLLLGIHLGTRRWTLRMDRSQLLVTLKSALRSREWRWAAGDIEDVRVGDSGTEVNERTLEQLQIHTRTGKQKTGLLTGRTHEELAWVATTLRGALRAKSADTSDAPPRIDPARRQS